MKFRKVYVEITNRCNLSCHFCAKDCRPKKEMSVMEFQHVIQEIRPYTNYLYLHVKGEPLLHSQFSTILQICDDYQMKVNITTNATLLLQQVEVIKRHECVKKLNLSLHCEQKDSQYFNHVKMAVDQLQGKTIIYRLWTCNETQMDANSQAILAFLSKAYELDETSIPALYHQNHVKIKEQVYVDKDHEFIWPSLTNEILNTNGYCYALKTHIAILSDLTVVPCCLDGGGILALGNLKEESLSSILQKERVKKIRKSFQDRKPQEALCQRCGFMSRLKK